MDMLFHWYYAWSLNQIPFGFLAPSTQMAQAAGLPAAVHCELNDAALRLVLLKYILMYWTVAAASAVGGPLVHLQIVSEQMQYTVRITKIDVLPAIRPDVCDH
jgi:hypothetical protein